MKRKRLNFVFPEAVVDRLHELREMTASPSLTDTVRRALSCYDILTRAEADGARLMVEQPDGQREQLRLV